MHIIENSADTSAVINEQDQRGDISEPARSEITAQMTRPVKIIYNVACQADLTVDAATSNRSLTKTVPKFYHITGD